MPLHMDDLGASGTTIGAVFLFAAAVEAVLSPITGRVSDRAGRMAPIRLGTDRRDRRRRCMLPLPAHGPAYRVGRRLRLRRAGHVLGARAWRCSPTPPKTPGSTSRSRSRSRTWPGRVGHVFGAGLGGAVADADLRRRALRGARRCVRRHLDRPLGRRPAASTRWEPSQVLAYRSRAGSRRARAASSSTPHAVAHHFPHPSGGNERRKRLYDANQEGPTERISAWPTTAL